jgi:hypothetical protein
MEISQLKDLYASNNVDWQEINIIGIRNTKLYNSGTALDAVLASVDKVLLEEDFFDDKIILASDFKLKVYTATTDPGKWWVLNPVTYKGVKGAAHVVEGFHKNIWQVGIHASGTSFAHEALVQTGNVITFWRDVNKDNIKDDNDPIQTGYVGINCHRAGLNDPKEVNKYSAGCQVFRFHNEFLEFMAMIKNSEMYKTNKACKFSYMLFNEDMV